MKIAGIFLIIFALCCPFLRGAVNLPCRITLAQEYSGGGDSSFLRNIIKRIDDFAKLAGEKSNSTRLQILSNAPEFRVYQKGKIRICAIPGSSRRWSSSFALRRQLHTAIFYARFDLPHNDTTALLPPWISAGIDETVFTAERSEQFVSGNRDYSLLREIFRITGKMPDFTVMTKMDLPEKGILRRCFTQQSRLLLEVFSLRKFLRRYLEKINSGAAADHWTGDFASAKEADYVIAEHAARLLWNRYAHAPAEQMMSGVPALEKTIVPELDKNLAPTGNMPEYNYRQCAGLMLQGQRPDIADIRNSFLEKITAFGKNGSPAVRQICSRLIAAVKRFDSSADAPDEYAKILEELKQQLALEKAQEEFLRNLSRRNLSPFRAYREHFRALTPITTLIGRELWQYFNSVK